MMLFALALPLLAPQATLRLDPKPGLEYVYDVKVRESHSWKSMAFTTLTVFTQILTFEKSEGALGARINTLRIKRTGDDPRPPAKLESFRIVVPLNSTGQLQPIQLLGQRPMGLGS